MDQLLLAGIVGVLVGALGSYLLLRGRMAVREAERRRLLDLSRKLASKAGNGAAEGKQRDPVARFEATATQLLRDERRLRAVLNAMSEGLALIDNNSRIVICNPSFVAMFRSNRSERISTDSFEVEGNQDFFHTLENTRETGKISTLELNLTTTPPRDILITLTPYNDPEIKDGLILTAFDVTQLRRAEQVRSEFVANVSHELRTPLAAIRGYVETCLEPVGEEQEPPYSRFLPIVHNHALRLSALIEDLLILSRIESKGMQLNIVPLKLGAAVENAIVTLANAAEKKNVRLLNRLPRSLPDVKADASALERILVNLIENAIKYSEEDSEVAVSARLQSTSLCVMVRDTGMGIPREHQERIFERFYRVDKARSRKAGGTGLGLSIVKHLVQSHDGEVWVDSEPGRGSTFFFTLPLAN